MHIEQVTIKNFRCFEHLEVKLNPDVNVFVGNNGSGKSALLKGITAALFPYVKGFQDFSSDVIRSKPPVQIQDFRTEKEALSIGKVLGLTEQLPTFNISTTLLEEIEVDYYVKRLSTRDSSNSVELSFGDSLSDFQEFLQKVENLKNPDSFDIPVLAFYGENRNNIATGVVETREQSGQSLDRISSFNQSLEASSSFHDLLDWLAILEINELKEAKRTGDINFESTTLRQLRKAISIVVKPNSRFYFAQSWSSKSELRVAWQEDSGETVDFSLRQLSAGYLNMLSIVMDFSRRLAQANPQLKNPLEAKAILLIDEIDLHLHPAWQQRVIPDLRKVFPNTQLIVTTHSPEVLTTVDKSQVFLLENYQLKDCLPPTRGRKSSELVLDVLGLADLRPETKEKQILINLFDAIDNGDIAAAKLFREELKSWESFDSDLTRADMQIRRMERRASA